MDKRLYEVLEGKEANYILPFFWQRGENEEILREEMARIHESGIGAVCVESRPHPDFAGPLWWRDMDIILDEAKKRDMRVWVLDDAFFPTGYANGWIKNKFPEKAKSYIAEKHIDVVGPFDNAAFCVKEWLNESKNPGDQMVSVVAIPRTGINEEMAETSFDITENISGGTLYWNIPEGLWRIFILYVTREGGGDQNYINIIDMDSVRVLIDAVYEPHYQRYKAEFGKTFAGFFSDEPGFGNTEISYFDDSIGRKRMVLPWSKEVPELLKSEFGEEYKKILPYLWFNSGSKSSTVRYKYMNIVTRLYDKCFTSQLGNWCRNRGVEYIGHVMEDQNVHGRLGPGAGHFFRALSAQDMSGIDVVYQQIMPGFDNVNFKWMRANWDGEFFHYALAKMGVSLGHIDPLKKGRTMCEIFGAYGWMAGLKLMKWLTDHMLVRGVNWFVPHAFSAGEFPDSDCPPHFYARHNNIQFRYFNILMKYTNRISHLLNGGIHVAQAAILYHAEAEWAGEYMYMQKPARVLAQNQIDFDIIPVDVLGHMDKFNAYLDKDRLLINGEEYRCLIIPYSQYIPAELARFAEKAADSGFEVIFISSYPEGICDNIDSGLSEHYMSKLKGHKCVQLDELAQVLRKEGKYEIATSGREPYLRYYHYRREDSHIFMFFNEHPYDEINTVVEIPVSGMAMQYDAFENVLRPAEYESFAGGTRLSLSLSAYESIIIVFGEPDEMCSGFLGKKLIHKSSNCEVVNIDTVWRVSLARAKEYPEFTDKIERFKLRNIASPDLFPGFTGTVRYEAAFSIDSRENIEGQVLLELGYVYEIAEVWINDRHIGTKICPPYIFDIQGKLTEGLNTIRIDVTNTLFTEQRDEISISRMLEPTGLIGPVKIMKPK